MRKQNSVSRTVSTSEANKNLKNTNSLGYVELDKCVHHVTAGGIDGQVDEMSAKLAVDTVISAFTEALPMRKGVPRHYLHSASKVLLTVNSKIRLKASVTVVMTNYAKIRYGQAGNTRFCLYRDRFLRAQFRDQSPSMDLVKTEKLGPDKLTQHQERHNFYCYLGQDKDFRPFIFKKLKLSGSDAAALMTRGMWKHLDDGLLKDTFADTSDEPQETVDAVEGLLLSMQPKDLGTYTFATIFSNKTYDDPNRKWKIKHATMIATPITLVLVVVTVILVIYFHNRQKKIDSMEQSFYDTIEYIQAGNYVRAKEERQKALDLAEDLGDKEVQKDAGNYMKLIESVVAGDDVLTGGEYSDTQRSFPNVRNRTRYADNLGLDYIDDRLEQASQYMSVYELISPGNTPAQSQQYDKTEEQYLTVKALAAQPYPDTGRDDAITTLEQIYADQSEQQAQEDEKTRGTVQVQTAAASVLAEDDAVFFKRDYESACAFHTTALQKYTGLEGQAQTDAVNAKFAAVDNKLSVQTGLAAEAEGYMHRAESRYVDKNYVQARKYYLLAKNVCAKLEDDSRVFEVAHKLELIEMGISEEEQVAREAEEATKAAKETKRQAVGKSTEPAPSETLQPEAVG